MIKKPLPHEDLKECGVSEWDCSFVNDLPHQQLYSLITAGRYMQMPGLVDLAAAKVASMLKNKSLEQILETFQIQQVCDCGL